MDATDTHCHLERFPRPPDVLSRSLAAGVRVIAVTSRPSDFRMLFPLYGRRRGVRLALGLHPLEIEQVDVETEVALFERYAMHTSFIGEVGLDFSRDGKDSRTAQESALMRLLAVNGVAEKLLSVHSRGAASRTIEKLRDARARRVVLHWFSGTPAEVDSALTAGFYFSINPAMTTSDKGRTIISRIPVDRLLVETDGPYARFRGRILEPRHVWLALDYLAAYHHATTAEISAQVATNLAHLVEGLRNGSVSESGR